MAKSKNPQVFKGTGLTHNEKRIAQRKFKKYKEVYHIDSLSDLQLLESLVFRETLQERTKEQIMDDVDDKKVLKPASTRLMNIINNNEECILILKEKLGLFEDKKVKDPFKHIQILKKKFKKWREENQGSRTLICPHCSKMLMLRIRTKAWEVQKHEFFRDRILTNNHLVKLFMDKKITKSDCAKILGVSEDYILWLIEKWYQNDKKTD